MLCINKEGIKTGKLTGKTALITGTLQETDEEIARTFVRHGANLILLDISPEIEKPADELCGRGHHYTAVVTDVRDPASVAVAIKHTEEKGGRIDILVDNTGACRLGNFLDVSDDGRDFCTDIDIKDVWNATKAVLPEMIAHKDNRIVMMSSITDDIVASPDETAYVLTKATIVDLAKSLAVEYAQSGIRVNTIHPGYVRTPVTESIIRQLNLGNPKSVLTEMAKTIPIRRLADPLGIGELAVFLASDESSYLTGTQNVIDSDSTPSETTSVGI